MEHVAKFAEALDKDEQVVWTGRPKFIPFIMPVIPGALLNIGLGVMGMVFNTSLIHATNDVLNPLTFFYTGLLFIVTAVWSIAQKLLLFDNTFYACSRRRVMIRSGIIETMITVIDYSEIVHMAVSTNLFERMHKAGTIRFVLKPKQSNDDEDNKVKDRWEAIDDPYDVFKKVQQIPADIKMAGSHAVSN